MRQFLLQFNKDFRAYFSNFNAYVIIGGYYILSFFFTIYFGDYFLREAEIINAYLSSQSIILLLILPAVTMRSWADEIKSGTIELLLTQPISYTSLVLAKFFAAYVFFLLLVLTSLPFVYLTDFLSISDIGATLCGYTGLLLCGGLFIAVGCLISWFNRNNILSYISTIFALLFITQFRFGTLNLNEQILALNCLNFETNYGAFLSGVISISNVVYFVLGSTLCLWLNVVAMNHKKAVKSADKKLFLGFCGLLFLIFTLGTLGTNLLFNNVFDVTDNHKFTLTEQSAEFLSKTDKRVDIVLYESQASREEAGTNYAVYAEFIERFLKMVERTSRGAVRTQIVRVEPFSTKESTLLRQNIPYKEDAQGNKVFMVADFSDNEGNSATINAFPALRQNLLEADIMRTLRRFGIEKKNVLLVAPQNLRMQLSAFQAMLKEFYHLTVVDTAPMFIVPSYSAVIVFSPTDYSTEAFLALEQYVLNGGNLFIFDEPVRPNPHNLEGFLLNFGFKPKAGQNLTIDINHNILELGPSYPVNKREWQGIRSVLVNGAGEIDVFQSEDYTVTPILKFGDKNIAMYSSGKFLSNYIYLAEDIAEILTSSKKDGKVFFFYDTDIFKDYLYVSEETTGNGFYEIIPTADNLLFGLQLINFAIGESVEQNLDYRHYATNVASIGHTLFNQVNHRYENQIQELQLKLDEYAQKKKDIQSLLGRQSFTSVRNIGDIGELSQSLEETENSLRRVRFLIAHDYRLIVMVLTGVIIFVVPSILLLLLAMILYFAKKHKSKQIKEMMNNA